MQSLALQKKPGWHPLLLGILLLSLSLPIGFGLGLPMVQTIGLCVCLITAYFVAAAWAKLRFDLPGTVMKLCGLLAVIGAVAVFLSSSGANLGQWVLAFGWISTTSVLFYIGARRGP